LVDIMTSFWPQVVLEMVELREIDTARAILRQTAVFARMKLDEPERFLRLEHLCGRTYFDIRRALPSICSDNVLFHVSCVAM
jgi:WD40 repeat-containing protein SMU1